MKRHPTLLMCLLLFAIAAGITATATLQVRRQNAPRPATLNKADEDFYTIADYSGPEPADAQKRAKRKVRARRFNMHGDKGADSRRFEINEDRESSFGLPPTHTQLELPLPAAQSGAVIIGSVKSGQAFLTEDKTDVISEFTIQIDEVLKENLRAPFSVGDSLDAVRGGGGVRFESGKIIRYGAEGRPLPKVGHRYIFFLDYHNDGGSDYSIITAYELQNDQVIPLDGISLNGVSIPAYAEYQKQKGAKTDDFLNDVRDAIARNLGGKPLQRGLSQ